MWISISIGFYISLIDSFLFLECLSVQGWNTAWIFYGFEAMWLFRDWLKIFLMQIWADGQHLCCWEDCFGFIDSCDGQDTTFPDHLEGGAIQGFLGQYWAIGSAQCGTSSKSPTSWHLVGYLPSKDQLILFSLFELTEPQLSNWHPRSRLNHILSSSVSPPFPVSLISHVN